MADARISSQQRQEVRARARGYCEYCRSPVRFAMESFDVDHVVPRSRGGATETGNLALACPGCNAHKNNKATGLDPVSGEAVALFHPRRDRWRDHFVWTGEFTSVLGITPKGRATVETLSMNREGLVNLRRLLHANGEHPPAEAEE
jgi:HNH endonuclease